MNEGKEIQKRLRKSINSGARKNTTKFTNLMQAGKLSQATKLTDRGKGGLLDVSEDVVEELIEKHPQGAAAEDGVILQGPRALIQEVIK